MTLLTAALPVVHDSLRTRPCCKRHTRAAEATAVTAETKATAAEATALAQTSAHAEESTTAATEAELTTAADIKASAGASLGRTTVPNKAVIPVEVTSSSRASTSTSITTNGGADATTTVVDLVVDLAAANAADEANLAAVGALSVRGTSGRLLQPVSVVWLCDGFNIFVYICEWSLFAVYFSDAYSWSSTLTGAAQMAGDLVAALVLALTTTHLWSVMLARGGATRWLDRWLLQPPWNLAIFFAMYAATFTMLASSIFTVSVLGQVFMGTIYVFNKQAVQECYVVLSHRSLPLFRTLEFVGSCSFNVWMAASSALSVVVYERLGMVAPFYMVAAFSGLWALVIVTFFCLRLRGLPFRQSFAESEHALLMQLHRSKAGGLTLNELELPRT